jgi:hypothetical protein
VELAELAEKMRERVPTEEEDLREVPLESLRLSDVGEEFLEGRFAGGRGWTEREKN